MENIILFADSNRGVYIPQHFAMGVKRELVQGVSKEEWDTLEAGPSEDNEWYFEAWNNVENNATIIHNSGKVYTLHHDGDLFLLALDDMTSEEKRNMLDTEEYGRDELANVVFDVPEWIDHDVTLGDMESIAQGGCASGAYMPAVTYHEAQETMSNHGDDVLDYIQNALGELPSPDNAESWSGMAVHYLSIAVELWSGQVDELDLED